MKKYKVKIGVPIIVDAGNCDECKVSCASRDAYGYEPSSQECVGKDSSWEGCGGKGYLIENELENWADHIREAVFNHIHSIVQPIDIKADYDECKIVTVQIEHEVSDLNNFTDIEANWEEVEHEATFGNVDLDFRVEPYKIYEMVEVNEA